MRVRLPLTLLAMVASAGIAAQELPGGPGRAEVAGRCLTCHEADLIAQQRLSRTGWGREIDKMVRWGAVVNAQERDAMLEYLAAHFARRPAATLSVSTASIEDTYRRACLACHGEDLIEAQRLARAGWTREVQKMVRWGAPVSDSEQSSLIDHLAARFPVR